MQKKHPVLFFIMVISVALLKYAPGIINSVVKLIEVLSH